MTQFSKFIFLPLAFIFNLSFCYCQNWTKQKKNSDTTFAIYSWEAHDDYHSAFGKIVLTKNGKFNFSSHYPLNFNEYSSGIYTIYKDTLTLTSGLQANNMKLELTYVDTTTSDTSYSRLSFPKNQKGQTFYHAYYFLNNDTTFKNHYDPMLPFHKELLDSITSLMVKFYDMDCGSNWISVIPSNKFIKVTMLTDENLDKELLYKVINWKFKISGDKLVALTNQ